MADVMPQTSDDFGRVLVLLEDIRAQNKATLEAVDAGRRETSLQIQQLEARRVSAPVVAGLARARRRPGAGLMRDKTRHLSLLALALLCGCTRGWQKARSDDGGYTVDFPGRPKQEARELETRGGTATLHLLTLDHGARAYFAGYYDIPGEAAIDVNAVLDADRDDRIKSSSFVLVSETPFQAAGQSGRDLVADHPSGKQIRSRNFVVGRRVYMLVVTGTKDADTEEAARRFVASFSMLSEGIRPPGAGAGAGENAAKEAELARRACEGGEAAACNRLAVMYESGKGVARNFETAAELFRKACDGGVPVACTNLAALYGNGHGVPKNAQTSADLYQRACDGGELIGCSHLGLMYAQGTSVARNDRKAFELFQKACNGDEPLGCLGLGQIYEDGAGVAQSSDTAAPLFRKACDGGQSPGVSRSRSCTVLGGASRGMTRRPRLCTAKPAPTSQ